MFFNNEQTNLQNKDILVSGSACDGCMDGLTVFTAEIEHKKTS